MDHNSIDTYCKWTTVSWEITSMGENCVQWHHNYGWVICLWIHYNQARGQAHIQKMFIDGVKDNWWRSTTSGITERHKCFRLILKYTTTVSQMRKITKYRLTIQAHGDIRAEEYHKGIPNLHFFLLCQITSGIFNKY